MCPQSPNPFTILHYTIAAIQRQSSGGRGEGGGLGVEGWKQNQQIGLWRVVEEKQY